MVTDLRLLWQPLRTEAMIETARRITGLDDFGDTPFEDGLNAFLMACAEEAELSLFGRLGTRWDVTRFLCNLLCLRHAEVQGPEILHQPIERPLFITGLPRSGTTFLHQLLAVDPANGAPRVWEVIHPYPMPGIPPNCDRRRKRVARQLRMFAMLAPGFRRLHPITADSAQECSEINAHVFASLRFDTTYSVPSYRGWLDQVGHLDGYRFHKRFLQHLQHQSGGRRRWVLKCPDHIFALGAIRAVYPDARFIFVHREPLRALSSVVKMTEVLRRPFSRRIDRAGLARREVDRWSTGAELIIQAADEEPFAEPICHLRYQDLVREPLDAVKRIYRHFGLSVDARALHYMGRMVQMNPQGGYGSNTYDLAAYQIDPDSILERFAPYVARFGLARESEGNRVENVPPKIAISSPASPCNTGGFWAHGSVTNPADR